MGHKHIVHHLVPLTGHNLYYLPWESYIHCVLPLDGRLTKSTLGGTTVQHGLQQALPWTRMAR